jgi:hypothetical protein
LERCRREIAVSSESFFESPQLRQQLSFVVAEDLRVAGIVRGSQGEGALHIDKRRFILAELKFAEPAQSRGGRGIGHETEIMGEGVFGLRVVVGAVTQLAEVPPAVRP